MSSNTYIRDDFVVLSSKVIPMILPPDLITNTQEIYNHLQETIQTYKLPVTFETIQFRMAESQQSEEVILIGLEEKSNKYLRVYVRVDMLGNLAYIERNYALITPKLPPLLHKDSEELPSRITLKSPELPPKKSVSKGGIYLADKSFAKTPFKSDCHRDRVVMIENRRRERYSLILRRKKERQAILKDWFIEVERILEEHTNNPLVNYLKDSIDIIIQIVITSLINKGAKTKEIDEVIRKNDEVMKIAKDMRKKF